MTKQTINKQIQEGTIRWSCFTCADKHRTKKPYNGTFTTHTGICDICTQSTPVTSARKLFGYHNFKG